MGDKKTTVLCLSFMILIGLVLSENENPDSEEINNEDSNSEDSELEVSDIRAKNKTLWMSDESNKFNCSDFNINDHLEIDQSQEYNWTKRLFDYDQESKSRFPYALKESLLSHNLRFMVPTALWIEEKNGYLVLSRFSTYLKTKIYASFFDKNWKEKNFPTSIGSVNLPSFLPVPENISNYYPEEIQLFNINNKIIAGYLLKESLNSRNLWLFSFDTGKNYKIQVKNYNETINWKKWSPLVLENKHLIFYNTQSSQILNCSNYELGCVLIFQNFTLSQNIYPGTPYTRYNNTNYYISFNIIEKKIYSNESIFDTRKLYRPILTILKSETSEDFTFLKLVYASNIFDFTSQFFVSKIKESFSLFEANHNIQYLKIASFAKWDFNNDVVSLMVHFIDRFNLAIPLKGLGNVVDGLIKADEKNRLNFDETCIANALNNYLDGTENYIWTYRRKIKKRNAPKKKSRKEKRDERRAKRQKERKVDL